MSASSSYKVFGGFAALRLVDINGRRIVLVGELAQELQAQARSTDNVLRLVKRRA